MTVAGRQAVSTQASTPRGCSSRRAPVAWRHLRFWAAIGFVSAMSGLLYNALGDGRHLGAGLAYGTVIGTTLMLFEQGHLLRGLRERVRRLPWLVAVLATEAVYIGLAAAASMLAGSFCWGVGLIERSFREAVVMPPITMLYAPVVAGVLTTMVRMRDLIGEATFRDVMLGRYHKPMEEERIVLFLDLVGSTGYAQRHGDLRAQALLGAIFAAPAAPVRDHGGAIDDYVGDMALVTWKRRDPQSNACRVARVFAFLDAVQADATRWQREFSEVPRFRAALHGGRVETAGVGIDRHKIACFGDVVNTTGHLEALSRTLAATVLMSGDLFDRLAGLPDGVTATDEGEHSLKGRGQSLTVWSLRRPVTLPQGRAA